MKFSYTIIFYGVAVVCLAVSSKCDRVKTRQAVKKAVQLFVGVFPHFLTILLISGMLFQTVTPQMIHKFVGAESGLSGLLLSALTGAVALIPVLAVFPIVPQLLEKGAGISQVAIFISTLTTVGLFTLPLEIKYIGLKAAAMRNALFFLFAFVTAFVLGGINI